MKREKRASDRRNLRVPVLCWRAVDGRPEGPSLQHVTQDLSASGLSFASTSIHPIDSLLLADVHLPGRGSPLALRLRVTRIESVLGKSEYLIGTRFVDIAEEDRDLIVSCLDKTNLYSILRQAVVRGASDVHLTVGRPPVFRISGKLRALKAEPFPDGQIKAMMYPLLTDRQMADLEAHRELDFAFSPSVQSRFRVNLHFQKGFLEATMRSVPTHTRSFDELGLPAEALERLCRSRAGLILIAGTTGSGKTTTMSSMVDYMNRNLERVVITVEDPVEFTHTSQRSIVKQRELGSDTSSYAEALRRSLRQDPDVIVVGELLDRESVASALRAGETGHLVISTVHAPDGAQAVERIVNLFPPEHRASLCQQIASSLVGILFQALLSGKNGRLVLATELLLANHAVQNLIREQRFVQLANCIQTGRGQGMYTLQSSLEELARKGLIGDEVAREYAQVK